MNNRSTEGSRDSDIILYDGVTTDSCHTRLCRPMVCAPPRVTPKLWPLGDHDVSGKLHQLSQMSQSGEGC